MRGLFMRSYFDVNCGYIITIMRLLFTTLLLSLLLFCNLPLIAQIDSFCNCNDISQGSSSDWPYVLTSCTIDDGNNGEMQEFQILITSLPETGSSFRVAKTVANGNWYIAPETPLVLGLNTKTVTAVDFTRTVKFQFSDCNIQYELFVLNQNAVCGGSPVILGCTNESACNYNAIANQEDNSCLFIGDPCDDGDSNTLDDEIQEDCDCAGIPYSTVDELEALSVFIYPNPASNNLTVDLDDLNSVNTIIKLYDSSSKLVFEKQSTSTLTIDVSGFAKGMYSLQLSNNEQVLRSKVIID